MQVARPGFKLSSCQARRSVRCRTYGFNLSSRPDAPRDDAYAAADGRLNILHIPAELSPIFLGRRQTPCQDFLGGTPLPAFTVAAASPEQLGAYD